MSRRKEEFQETEYRPHSAPKERRRRRSSSQPWSKLWKLLRRSLPLRVVVIAACVGLIVIGLLASVLIADSLAQLGTAWEGLSRVMNSINGTNGTELTLNDFNRLEASLSDVYEGIEVAESRLSILGPFLGINPDWRASADALAISKELGSSALAMLSGLQPALDFMVQDDEEELVATGISSGQRVVELLELGQGRFQEAEDALRLAEAKLGDIDLTQVSAEVFVQIEELRSYHEQLVNLNTVLLNGAEILSTTLGLDEERTYLVLAQNNDEIRPSGGYISTYGWFTVEEARIVNFDYSPTTTSSPNPPDAEFMNDIELPDWWIRYNNPLYAAWDGSWYADFPSTAAMAMDYYNAGDNPESPVDGVMAIDISGFELILGAIGPVNVPEYDVVVSAENFREIVYDIRAFGEGETPHKLFVAAVYQAIFAEWRSIEQTEISGVLDALIEAMQSRHIMIYFADAELNAVVGRLGWNGAQAVGSGYDYLLIADANLGNKSNFSIIRSLTYDARINQDGSINSRLGLRYDYFDSVASNDPAVNAEYHGPLNYNNLLQIFLPANSELSSAENLEYRLIELESHSLLVNQSSVAYDSSEHYSIEYQTPVLVERIGSYQRYRLLIQKQAGARSQLANIQISLPGDAVLVYANPEPDANYELEQAILNYSLEIDGDVWIELIYQAP